MSEDKPVELGVDPASGPDQTVTQVVEVGPEPEPFTLRLEDLFPATSKPLGQMTRDERLAAKEAERTRRQLSAILNDSAECAAPPQKRRMGHSRRPDWTVRSR